MKTYDNDKLKQQKGLNILNKMKRRKEKKRKENKGKEKKGVFEVNENDCKNKF